MTAAPHLSVERLSSTVAILGACPFAKDLAAEFVRHGLELVSATSEADYLLIWDNSAHPEPSSRNIFLHPFGRWEKSSSSRTDRHIYLGSLYGGDCHDQLLLSFIQSAQNTNTINLRGDGVGKHYLLNVKDAVPAIVTATIHPSSSQEIYLLGVEYSLLSLVYRLRNLYSKHLTVNFLEQQIWEEPAIDWDKVGLGLESLGLRTLGSDEQHDEYLASYLRSLISSNKSSVRARPRLTKYTPPKVTPAKPLNPPQTANKITPLSLIKSIPPRPPRRLEFEPILPPPKPPKVKKHLPKFHFPSVGKRLSSFILIVVIGIFLYFASLLTASLLFISGIRSLSRAIAGDITTNQSYALSSASSTYLKINLLAWSELLHNNKDYRDIANMLDGINYGFAMSKDLLALKNLLSKVGSGIISSEGSADQDHVADINQARILVESTYDQLSLIQGILPVTYPTLLPKNYRSRYDAVLSDLSLAKTSILKSKAILTALPDLIALGGRKKYALLLQNNMELRPTGGFIGSFAVLSFDNGKLYDLPVYDVYSADGQLKGHVEPPLPIRKYLGEANWFMRDSNWDPDFQITSDRIEWYLKKTLNLDIDGVIGINLNTIQGIVRVLGTLSVPDYDETITADNLFEKTEYHSEVGFFPGSTQKKEFLASLASALLARLETADASTLAKVMVSLIEAADRSDLLISMNSDVGNSIFHNLGWSGELKSASCGDGCLASYLSVVDANVGVNKANYFLQRSIDLVVELDRNLNAEHTLTLNAQNTASSNAWPAGPYKNYQRLYIPKDAELLSLKRDGIEIPPRDIDISYEHNKKSLGYLVTTPTSGNSQIIAKYRVPNLTTTPVSSFSFYWQKQPGTFNDSLKVILNYPIFLTPTTISPAGEVSGNSLTFDLSNSSDRRVMVNFATK